MSTPAPILQYTLNNKDLLPAGYTPLAYIESTGTLWINSGIALNGATSTYTFSCKVGASTRDGHAHSFFGTSSYLTGMMGIYHYTNNNYYSEYIQNANKGTQGKVIPKGNIFEYYLKMNMNAKTYASRIGDSSEVTGSFSAMSNTSDTIRVFKSDDYPGGYWKCYYFRITKDNVLQVDLVPCIQDSNGAIGMYDLVSRSFKANSGSGTFIAGPPLAIGKGGGKSLPEEYLLVEYIQSSGTQYINTGVKNNELIQKIETNWKVVEQVPQIMFGCYDGTYYTYIDYCESGYQARQYLYKKGTTLSYYMYTGTEIRTTITRSSNYSINSSGYTGSVALEDATPTSTKEHYLFAYNNNGSPAYYTKGQLREFRLWTTTGGLVRNFIPCYRKSDMKPGMYDTVNGVFYTNAGSGEFILGPTITNCYTWEPNASGKVALNPYDTTIYTESDGSRWMRIFHHNNPTDNKFASGVNLSNNVYESANKWSCILMINKNLGSWELMLKQKDTSSSSEVKYRWILRYNPYTATWDQVKPGTILNISNATQGGLYVLNSNTYFVIANSSNGNWYGALGCWVSYDGGIPGYPNTTCKTGYMDLYVRIDNNISFTPDGLYTNVSGIYDSSKGWVADFSTSSVEMPGLLTLLGSSTNFSFAVWFKRSSGGGWNTIWGCSGFELEGSRSGGATNLVVAYTWGQSSSGGIEYTLNEWHHLVMTRNASESKFYLDGELKYTGSAASIPNTALFLGAWKQHGSQSYLGQMTNMMLFDVVLTAAQVKELYGQ